jgi:hypothetical protein
VVSIRKRHSARMDTPFRDIPAFSRCCYICRSINSSSRVTFLSMFSFFKKNLGHKTCNSTRLTRRGLLKLSGLALAISLKAGATVVPCRFPDGYNPRFKRRKLRRFRRKPGFYQDTDTRVIYHVPKEGYSKALYRNPRARLVWLSPELLTLEHCSHLHPSAAVAWCKQYTYSKLQSNDSNMAWVGPLRAIQSGTTANWQLYDLGAAVAAKCGDSSCILETSRLLENVPTLPSYVGRSRREISHDQRLLAFKTARLEKWSSDDWLGRAGPQ